MIIYKATCSIEGKSYIGQTVRNLTQRKGEHLRAAANISLKLKPTLLQAAISKFGSGAFTWEILEECPSIDHMNEREKFYIKLLSTMTPHGYNQTAGGAMDEFMSETIRERISKSMTENHQDPEYRANLYPQLKGRIPPNKGVPMSEEQKLKVGAARKAAYDVPGYVNPNIGQERTPEQMERLKAGWAKRDLGGEKWHTAHDGQFTPEVREKMRQAKVGKKPANTKQVMCIETGQVFDGLTEAAKALDINRQSIWMQLKGKIKAAGGKHFKYLERHKNKV